MHLSNELTRYKQENNLIDYNDMILEFIKSDAAVPKFDVVFIDEAQDFLKCNGIWLKLFGIKQQTLLSQAMMIKQFLDGQEQM